MIVKTNMKINFNKAELVRSTIILFPIFLIILMFITIEYSESLYTYLLAEDGLLEWIQFGSFFVASVIGVITAIKARKNKLYFALFTLFSICCAFIALDEISWGQRIFNLSTPEFFLERNLQLETNIHNLDFIHFNYLHHKAYIFIGIYGSLAWLLLRFFKVLRKDFFYFVVPKQELFFYFLPIAIYYFWLDYLTSYYWPNLLKGLDMIYVYRIQEIFETNLAIGFLLIAYLNYQKTLLLQSNNSIKVKNS